MKRFLFGVLSFFIPIAVFFAVLEVLAHTIPNSYSYKYKFIKNNGKCIEAIAIGHSQLYDGFMPEAFGMHSFNLCNSSQSYKEDYYLLLSLLPCMPNLKLVILPIGYINVNEFNSDEFNERSAFYYEYMNISYDNTIPVYCRYEFFYPKRTFEKITSFYLHHLDIVGCDSLGRRNSHYLKHRQQKMIESNMLKAYTLSTHSKNEMFFGGEKYLMKIGYLLQSKHIKLVLVSPPHFWSCFDDMNSEQKLFLQEKIVSYKHKFLFQYINLEDDNRFVDDDFFDDAHLSELGAEKFTRILNDSISI